MPKTINYKELAAKLKTEVQKLKKANKELVALSKAKMAKHTHVIEGWLAEEFEKGYKEAFIEMEKMQVAFDNYMDKAAQQFEKNIAKKYQKKPLKKKKTSVKRKK